MDLNRAAWRKSTRSNANGQCVEIADNISGIVAVRDSKDPAGPALVVSSVAFGAFTASLKRH